MRQFWCISLDETFRGLGKLVTVSNICVFGEQLLTRATMTPPEEVVIAILGVTGAGKSSLIQRITRRNDIYIENGLSSGTLLQKPRPNLF